MTIDPGNQDFVRHGDGDFTPRITVRDRTDAITLITALEQALRVLYVDYSERAKHPGADQYALSMQLQSVTRDHTELVQAIVDGHNSAEES